MDRCNDWALWALVFFLSSFYYYHSFSCFRFSCSTLLFSQAGFVAIDVAAVGECGAWETEDMGQLHGVWYVVLPSPFCTLSFSPPSSPDSSGYYAVKWVLPWGTGFGVLKALSALISPCFLVHLISFFLSLSGAWLFYLYGYGSGFLSLWLSSLSPIIPLYLLMCWRLVVLGFWFTVLDGAVTSDWVEYRVFIRLLFVLFSPLLFLFSLV